MTVVDDVHVEVQHVAEYSVCDAEISIVANDRPVTVTRPPPERGMFRLATDKDGASKESACEFVATAVTTVTAYKFLRSPPRNAAAV